MKIVKTRSKHNCIICGKDIPKGIDTLVEYFDSGTYAGRHYYCRDDALEKIRIIKTALALQKKLRR